MVTLRQKSHVTAFLLFISLKLFHCHPISTCSPVGFTNEEEEVLWSGDWDDAMDGLGQEIFFPFLAVEEGLVWAVWQEQELAQNDLKQSKSKSGDRARVGKRQSKRGCENGGAD